MDEPNIDEKNKIISQSSSSFQVQKFDSEKPEDFEEYKSQSFSINKNYETNITSDDSLEDTEGKEKTDVTPENLKKIDDVIPKTSMCNISEPEKDALEINKQNKKEKNIELTKKTYEKVNLDNTNGPNDTFLSEELKIVEYDNVNDSKNNLSTQNSLSFTIDFGNSASSHNTSTEAKYKSMLERFQSRHKRGSSMSKLEISKAENVESTTKIGLEKPNDFKENKKADPSTSYKQITKDKKSAYVKKEKDIIETSKVKMRVRDKGKSRVLDSDKRHSWSPRSSTAEHDYQENYLDSVTHKTGNKLLRSSKDTERKMNAEIEHKAFRPTNRMNIMSLNKTIAQQDNKQINLIKLDKNSPGLQLDFMCQQPPLNDFVNSNYHTCGSDDVSETGTYTLDGDNYTEEQKELMNIDKSKMDHQLLQQIQHDNVMAYDLKTFSKNISRPSNLNLTNSSFSKNNKISQHNAQKSNERRNILEISLMHESLMEKPKVSYLEKFKSRLKEKKLPDHYLDSQSKFAAPNSSPTDDAGTFTSITTSGVLAKKSSLDKKPKLFRKSSLTTSQIDSSEYVSTPSACLIEKSLQIITNKNPKDETLSNSYTDHQKAEYCLNIFKNQTDSQLFSNDFDSSFLTSNNLENNELQISDAAVLKTAQTKNDWIQEWARNARARSVSSVSKPTDHKHLIRSGTNNTMTRSCNCDQDSNITGSEFYYGNNEIENFKNFSADIGNEYSSSDPNVNRIYCDGQSGNIDLNNYKISSRPPISPSKIPSPLHSIGRARSINKIRSSLQDLSPLGDDSPQNKTLSNTELYIKKNNSLLSKLPYQNSSANNLSSMNQSPKRLYNLLQYSGDGYNKPLENCFHHNGQKNLNGENIFESRIKSSSGCTKQMLDQNKKKTNNNYMSNSFSNEISNFQDYSNEILPRQRKNSYDSSSNKTYHRQTLANPVKTSPLHYQINSEKFNQQKNSLRNTNIDQTFAIQRTQNNEQENFQKSNSPLRRSSSFSTKPMSNIGFSRHTAIYKTISPISAQNYTEPQKKQNVQHILQKSASINSFRKMYSDYDDSISYYINDEDDLEYDSSEDFEEQNYENSLIDNEDSLQHSASSNVHPGRYNKAVLLKIKQSRDKLAEDGNKTKVAFGGVAACPNTPEFPKRTLKSANNAVHNQRSSMRQSVPRDSSLNRLKGNVPNSLASAKKQILQSASKNNNLTAQPRYLDISKYKSTQNTSFLKKDESKSTLQKQFSDIKKSSNTAALTRTDPTRISNRSTKSVSSLSNKATSLSNRSARDSSVSKQKEAELEMWRRRAKYDPMKAAAEDKKKKIEAKKQMQDYRASESSSFCRSQSYHTGVVGLSNRSSEKEVHQLCDDEDEISSLELKQ